MGSLGPLELILIFLAVLLLFGAKRIPEIARGLGKGIREFKTATKEIADEFKIDESKNRIHSPSQPIQGTTTPRETETVQSATAPEKDSGAASAQPPVQNT